jgi:hypothetical protein
VQRSLRQCAHHRPVKGNNKTSTTALRPLVLKSINVNVNLDTNTTPSVTKPIPATSVSFSSGIPKIACNMKKDKNRRRSKIQEKKVKKVSKLPTSFRRPDTHYAPAPASTPAASESTLSTTPPPAAVAVLETELETHTETPAEATTFDSPMNAVPEQEESVEIIVDSSFNENVQGEQGVGVKVEEKSLYENQMQAQARYAIGEGSQRYERKVRNILNIV